MAAGAEAGPPVFLRKATGLVKGWSGFDALTYSFMSVNLVALGMEGYARVQKVCLYGALIGLAVMFALMLFSSQSDFQAAFNREAASLFEAQGDVYQRTIQVGSEGNGVSMPNLSFTPLFGPTLLLVPFMLFWILYPNWGASLYGEVRGASDFRRVLRGMFLGL